MSYKFPKVKLQYLNAAFLYSLGHEVLENTNQDSPTRELVSPENTARMANQLESLARQLSMRSMTLKNSISTFF